MVRTTHRVRIALGTAIHAEELEEGSLEYLAAQRLRNERFARVRVGPSTQPSAQAYSYVEATQTAQDGIITIGAWRQAAASEEEGTPAAPGEIIATLRLELAGATLIESMMSLRPGSQLQRDFESEAIAEIGGLAAREGLDLWTVVDALDGICAVILEIGRRNGVETFLTFPRAGSMSLIRAEVPGVLPGFHFTLSPDISGWQEDSTHLAALRSMRLRGFLDQPLIYRIAADDLASDLDARRALYEQRTIARQEGDLPLRRAMVRAERGIRQEIAHMYPPRRATGSGEWPTSTPDGAAFLPPELRAQNTQAAYLRSVIEQGAPVQAYKEYSFALLDIQPGMSVLDVGCGAGVDLPRLGELAGPRGRVIGLEAQPQLVREALQATRDLDPSTHATLSVLCGDAHHMTIPDETVDRVRTDRAMLHFREPRQALAEMWRVLSPDGVLSMVEPDWGSIVLAPGSADDAEGDATVQQVFDWCKRRIAHPYTGRMLHRWLHEMNGAWESIQIHVVPFTLQDWATVDAVLLLSSAARALAHEQPEVADDIREWQSCVEEASANGQFFAYIPLFYATARKRVGGGFIP